MRVGVGSTQGQRCNLVRSPAAVPSGSDLSSVSSVIMMETTDLWNGFHLAVLSKNTNGLKTGAPGRFGSETSEAWLANGS